MRKKIVIGIALAIALIGGHYLNDLVLAQVEQEISKNAPTPTATPAPSVGNHGPSIDSRIAKAEEDAKAKPIIVSKTQILQSENLALKLQNAQLAAQAAIPAELRKAIDEAEKALNEYYSKEIGVARDKLSEYEISPGVDGALILRKKVAPVAGKK